MKPVVFPDAQQALSETIRICALSKGMPLYIVADFAGIRYRVLSGILAGTKEPTLNMLIAIVYALRVDPVEFVQMVIRRHNKIQKQTGR